MQGSFEERLLQAQENVAPSPMHITPAPVNPVSVFPELKVRENPMYSQAMPPQSFAPSVPPHQYSRPMPPQQPSFQMPPQQQFAGYPGGAPAYNPDFDPMYLRARIRELEARERAGANGPNYFQTQHRAPPLPKFRGSPKESVSTWLYQVEEHCRLFGPPENMERVQYVGCTGLEGDAATWYRYLKDSKITPITSWDLFVTALRSHFVPIDEIRLARDELALLSQGRGGVREYNVAFQRVCIVLAGEISESEKFDRYRGRVFLMPPRWSWEWQNRLRR
jgi:hypothetical protein